MFETRLTNEMIDRYVSAGIWRDRVLHDFVREWPASTMDDVAVVGGAQTYTKAQVTELSGRLAVNLLDLGVRPRDVVSVQMPNVCEFVVLALALERIGAVINPISMIMREREVTQMVQRARSRLLVVPRHYRGFDHGAQALAVSRRIESLEHVVVIDDESGVDDDDVEQWSEVIAGGPPSSVESRWLDRLRPDPNDVVLLSFTSGTTGEPKGVLHTHNTLVAMVTSTVRRQGFDSSTVIHMAMPFGHAMGYYWGYRMPLQVGGRAVLQSVWDPAEAVRLIAEHGATFSMGSTAFLIDLLEAAADSESSLRSLEGYFCGGAKSAPSTLERAAELMGARVFSGWGMTENGICTSQGRAAPVEKMRSTDGSPQDEVEIRVVGEDGVVLPPGEPGRLQVRTPFNFVGYIQGRAFTSAYFDEDWFDTGDLATIDTDGYMRITGRSKDIIIRGGENIPVAEIEDILYELPAVKEVILVGIEDERLGERACACVLLSPGSSLQLSEVTAVLERRGVARNFWPERLEIFEEFPRTASGKVKKFLVQQTLRDSAPTS